MRQSYLLFFCFAFLAFGWLIKPANLALANTSATGTVEVTAEVAPAPPLPPQQGGALPLYDSVPPLLFNLQIIRLTPTEADIYWETNEPATGFAQYGKTLLYEKGVAVGEVYVWKHLVYLKNLDPDTLYHFRIRSGDSFGNEAVSLDQTFTTPKTPDLQPPLINFLRFENIKERSAEAVWQTDEPSRAELILFSGPDELIFPDKEYKVNHRLLLAGLKPATPYQVKLQTFDPARNRSEMSGSFKTLIDKTPPANPANFTALSGDSVIYLFWRNPPDPDFDQVVLVYRPDRLPKKARDGLVIYQGKDIRFIHHKVKNGQFYYYGLFALDDVGNSSSGSLLQVMPQAPPLGPPPPPVPPGPPVAPPLPTIPVTPPISIPPVNVPIEMRLSPFDFNVWAGQARLPDRQGRILLKHGPAGEIEILPGQAWRITLSRKKVNEEDLNDLIGIYDGSAYRFYKDDQNYLLDLPAPIPTAGELELIVILSYKNNQNDVISFKIKLHSLGRIYEIERITKIINPVVGAEVSLLDEKKNLWPGADFGQKNPVLTDAAGHYGFMAPNGHYYLRVLRSGFLSFVSQSFEVKNNIVAQELRLFRLPLTIGERLEKTKDVLISWRLRPEVKLGLLTLLLLLLFWFLFWRKKR